MLKIYSVIKGLLQYFCNKTSSLRATVLNYYHCQRVSPWRNFSQPPLNSSQLGPNFWASIFTSALSRFEKNPPPSISDHPDTSSGSSTSTTLHVISDHPGLPLTKSCEVCWARIPPYTNVSFLRSNFSFTNTHPAPCLEIPTRPCCIQSLSPISLPHSKTSLWSSLHLSQ